MGTRTSRRLAAAHARFFRTWPRVVRLQNALVEGLWLGLLDDEAIDLVDEQFYRGFSMYSGADYNRGGLFDWEAAAATRWFPPGGRVVVTGAGGGREVVGLLALGFDAVGFEPNGDLVQAGAGLPELGPDRLRLGARDRWPDLRAAAAVVGWGAYMHIRPRAARVSMLAAARENLPDGGHVLVSYLPAPGGQRLSGVVVRTANLLRRLRRASRLERGDRLLMMYLHFFSDDEIAAEAAAAGFDVVDAGRTAGKGLDENYRWVVLRARRSS